MGKQGGKEEKKGKQQGINAKQKSMEQVKSEEVIISEYQRCMSFEERMVDSMECRRKHPECVPVIIERASEFTDIKNMENSKFLFNGKSQTAQVMLRTQKDVQAKKMWFFVHMPNNTLKVIYPQSLLNVLYSKYRRSDGNLYIFYSDKDLVNKTSTFMFVIQIICGILLLFYGFLYFFGPEPILNFFGTYPSQQNQEMDPQIINPSDKIEL